ncbi:MULTISPECIES: arginine repressor [Streptococcus]|uniref:Arginine repressor n=1 Tax=Streptococcus caledonicus TaxID=2614158 RepID=A0ABW0UDP8_9STRE|nr:arginine repressor [Streptococcus sp. S784/96/1]
MNKKNRHELIKMIISENHVGTQEEIKVLLEDYGVSVTQATLSRDLRELSLLKLRDDEGKLYYSLSEAASSHFSQAARSYIRRVARAGFMLVFHTELGEADVLANIIDKDANENILGTIAGADTLLVVCKDETIASDYEKDLLASI